jgi:6-phosphogluconolactonase/glucosamine-6-phosphate isomerase/deaminase
VLPVDKKTPTSITMSLSLMNAAKFRQVVLMGKDKADAGTTHSLIHSPTYLLTHSLTH